MSVIFRTFVSQAQNLQSFQKIDFHSFKHSEGESPLFIPFQDIELLHIHIFSSSSFVRRRTLCTWSYLRCYESFAPLQSL